MTVGYIYILVNPLFDYMVKIGYAKDVKKRIKELSGSGLPDPYHCYAVYGVTEARTDLEVHNLIDNLDPDLRHNANREFYEIDKERAYKILESIAKISGTADRLILNPFNDEYFNNTAKEKDYSNDDRNVYEITKVPEGIYHNKKKTAYARVDKDGNWIILKGSYANTKTYNGYAMVRREIQKERWAIIEDEKFTEDFNMNDIKPSSSAEFIENYHLYGWDYWYTENDISIREAFPRNKKN